MSIQLTEEQQGVVDNRGGSLLVSAAAGSGKTAVLVQRLLKRVLEEGADLDSFLIITYTKAAAAELRGKIIDALNRKLAEQPDNRHLRRQTTLVYRAQISTIHAFCTTVLREAGHLLDLDPDFRVADDNECAVLKQRALKTLLEKHYETVTPGDEFSVLVDTMSAGRDDRKLQEMVLTIHSKVQSHADPSGWLQAQRELFRLDGVTELAETEWGRLLMEDAKSQTAYWQSRMNSVLQMLDNSGDEALAKAYTPTIKGTIDSLSAFAAGLEESWDAAAARSTIEFSRPGVSRKIQNIELRELVRQIRDNCKKRMGKVTERFSCTGEELLTDLRCASPAVIALLKLVEEFDAAYTEEKRRRKLVDFSDLEHLALQVLVKPEGGPTDTARRLAARYAEVMVDEYQDTNQVQNAIFDALTGEKNNLFMVGDVKQSIYRFRLADPTIFLDRFGRFPYAAEAGEGEPRKMVLSRNFRSRASVLEGTNFLFRGLMSHDFGEIDYTEDHWLNVGASYPEQGEDMVELDVIDCAAVETAEEEQKPSKRQIESRFLAERIRKLVEDGYPISEGEGFRPVDWSDIVILYRSPGSVMLDLTRALDSARVPWQAEGGEDFFAAGEVMTALSYLQIIDNPCQDVPLISVLRSPLYGFTPDRLAAIRADCSDKKADFYTALTEKAAAGDEACTDFLTELKELRFRAADCSAAELLWQLYEYTGMPALYSAMESGETRRGNLILLYEYARQFEAGGHKGLFGFITQLRRLQESGGSIRISGTRGSGVRIMSIHKSKGLEFPVVLLAGLSNDFNRTDEHAPMLFHSRLGVGPRGLDTARMVEYPTVARQAVCLQLERELCAEELRLLYVAMTRAKEKLIMVAALKDAQKKLSGLCPGADWPMEPQALMSMSCMSDWILSAAMTRPEGLCLCVGLTPEGHYTGTDPKWTINLLDGQKPERWFRGKKGEAPKAAAPLPLDHLDWSYPHAAAAQLQSKLTATQLKGRFQDEEAAEDTARRRPVSFRRPDFIQKEKPLTAAEKGTALHLFMQLCEPEKCLTEAGAKRELARLMEKGCMTEKQAKACEVKKAAAFWNSELGQQALNNGAEREYKFSILSDAERYYGADGRGEQVLLQGVVDLWFRSLEGITVVDFKTDHLKPGEEPERAKTYAKQLQVYSHALEEITGLTTAHRWLWFFSTGTAVEIPAE